MIEIKSTTRTFKYQSTKKQIHKLIHHEWEECVDGIVKCGVTYCADTRSIYITYDCDQERIDFLQKEINFVIDFLIIL